MAGENTTTFFSRIMDLYRQAEFPEGSLFLVTDRLIHGCSNKEAKKKLMLLEKDVTIKQCLDVLKKQEALEASLKRIEDAEDVRVEASFARLHDRDPTRQSQRNGARRQQPRPQPSRRRSAGMPDFPCSWCDAEMQHPRHLCPARHAVCQFCGKDGHFERACFRKRATQHQHAVDISLNPEQYSHFSLVRTIWGKEKILYYRELLVSEKFFKTRWIPLALPSPVNLGETFFYIIEIYLLVRNFCITLGFPCGFTVSAESPVYFGRKVQYLSFSSSFIGSRFV